jgi:glycine dehydrogenase subunit 2
MRQISKEAYENPELVKGAPHNSTIHEIPFSMTFDMESSLPTWRRYKKVRGIE